MKRFDSRVFIVSILFIIGTISLLTSCEGPAGAGAEETCSVCHDSEDKIEFTAQFASSAHKGGEIAVDYAGGRSYCYPCHSSEQFIEYANLGVGQGGINNPSAWSCETCHNLHVNFDETDWSLRLSGPVSALFDTNVTLDFGNNSNLCANCHQSRRAEPNTTNPGTTFEITSSHYGPHHGPQANLVAGVGFAEIAGSAAYPEDGSNVHFSASCVGCHMGEYDGEEDAGGHTWHASISSCNDCHTTTDFDYGGVQTDIEEKLDELKALLMAQGVIEEGLDTIYELNESTGVIEQVVISDGIHPVLAEHTMAQAQAFFNWIGIEEDRSLGVHNPKYIDALLTNIIEAIK